MEDNEIHQKKISEQLEDEQPEDYSPINQINISQQLSECDLIESDPNLNLIEKILKQIWVLKSRKVQNNSLVKKRLSEKLVELLGIISHDENCCKGVVGVKNILNSLLANIKTLKGKIVLGFLKTKLLHKFFVEFLELK